jgi:trehalose 6-phosphate synthase/phosphatase
MKGRSRLIIVSNRLPTSIDKLTGDVRPAAGGLVTALTSLCRNRSVCWVGWPGVPYDETLETKLTKDRQLVYEMRPVWLTEQEQTKYYYGLSNEIIWPLFHDLQSRCNFEPGYWEIYGVVNRKFADMIAEIAMPEDHLWIHDYHLALVGGELKRIGVQNRSGYFHHIPFPAFDVFEKLPWREEFLRALLEFDQLGFQTLRDAKNFTRCVRKLLEEVVLKREGDEVWINSGGRETRVGHYPISIDFNEFAEMAHLPSVRSRAKEVREQIRCKHLLLGVDRLDYTKGIPERLKAFEHALKEFPELCRSATLVQIVVPSREDIPMYRELKMEIERLVTEINGRFTQPGWVPIHFLYRHLEREELVALYQAADVAMVTPLKDGMNLVSKEYCACQVSQQGVLVLSEFAGAAPQLRSGALIVNPYDRQSLAAAIRRACEMPESERRQRMHMMRKSIKRFDVHWWARKFLGTFDNTERDIGSLAVTA